MLRHSVRYVAAAGGGDVELAGYGGGDKGLAAFGEKLDLATDPTPQHIDDFALTIYPRNGLINC